MRSSEAPTSTGPTSFSASRPVGDVGTDHAVAVADHLRGEAIEIASAAREPVNADEDFRAAGLAPFEIGDAMQAARARALQLAAPEGFFHFAGRSQQRSSNCGIQRTSSPNEPSARPPSSGRSTLLSFSVRIFAARTGYP